MSEHNHLIMRTILGAVLAFQGAKLLGMLLQDKPDNYILMAVLAIAFIAVGTIFAVNSVRNFIALKKEDEKNVIRYEDMKKAEAEKMIENEGNEENKEETKEGEDELCE